MEDRITINGISYVKEHQPPDDARFYYMHDGFVLTRLRGASLEDIAAQATEIARSPRGAWGSLCPVILVRGNTEVRRVGPMVHAKGCDELNHKWDQETQKWIQALKSDPDVMRLVAQSGNHISQEH